jgi:hypothetical protein
MICRSSGDPAIARSSHCRQAVASSVKPLRTSAASVIVASRSQQKR